MRVQATIVQSPLLYRVKHQAVPLLEQGAAGAGPQPPPLPPPLTHVDNVMPSPLLQYQQPYNPEMVASKAASPAKFHGNMKNLVGWILQMHDYFTIMQTCNEVQ